MPIKDVHRALDLLTLVEKVANVAPGHTHLTGEAMAELRELNETIRKEKLKEQGQPVTPAQYGDEESPMPPQGAEADSPALSKHPTASSPTKASVEPPEAEGKAEPPKPFTIKEPGK